MANHEGRLLTDLNTNYADVVVDIGKIHLGKNSRKKSFSNQRTERNVLSTAVYALLNSGGGIVKMESEDRNYSFQEHGIGEDIERSLRDCVGGSNTFEYFTWMQKGSNLLLFVKTWSCGGLEQGSAATKPRLCSLSTGLFWRSGSSVYPVTSRDVPEFLRKKKDAKWLSENRLSTKRARVTSGDGANKNIQEHDIQLAAARFIERDNVLVGERLHFTETTHIEFKKYSTKCILEYIRKNLPKYVSAFANTEGGYIFFGVDDDGKVTGSHSDVEKEALEQTVADAVGSTSVYHFCGSGADVQFQTHILGVYDQAGCSHGYVCAVCIEPSCCPVFDGDPESWMVMGDKIERLRVRKWMELMTAADPDLSDLADDFRIQLSLANGPPLVNPVYCKADLQCAAELQEHLYPVGSNEIKWKPETICTDLFSEYPGLEDLLRRQLHGLTRGILILSRSWAVDIGLQKSQDVVCDALLVADNQYPVLFTVVKDASCGPGNWKETARALKQKLVNDGGYTSRVCVIPQILQLNGTNDQMGVAENDVPWQEAQSDSSSLYPKNYILTSRDIPAFLQALVIVVLRFKSYLSDSLGCEIFNLLTLRQYELISSNLHKVREQFVLGLPGTGKTIVALKVIERIKNTFRCSAEEILYICGSEPLRDFVGNENCQAVTCVTFMKKDFPHVKHIVVDEAQNFCHDEGDWYQRAQSIVKERGGIFWVFLDFFQATYSYDCGLDFSNLYPREYMTKVVRNAMQIYSIMFPLMSQIRQTSNNDVLNEMLDELLHEAECAHSLSGDYIVKKNINEYDVVKYVTEHCKSYIEQGYRLGDIAILLGTVDEAWFKGTLQPMLEIKLRNRRVREVVGPADSVSKDIIVIDSIQRFSGLERRIVFVIFPSDADWDRHLNLLLCAMSRANTKLHFLYYNKFQSQYYEYVRFYMKSKPIKM